MFAGNYVISGGSESVLVLWQLDTGRKQFLPHLPSHIRALVVSPTGDAYALKLADNSSIVLSTSELVPTASIIGLQLPCDQNKDSKALFKTHSTSRDTRPVRSGFLPAALSPFQPDHLLLAVPSSPTSSQNGSTNSSFLQTFDIRSGRHLSRQALTRTNISVLKSGPQGNDITTPDVKFLSLSFDGKWLTTVDEWQQYPDDIAVLHPSSLGGPNNNVKFERFLKFWHRNESTADWELVSRFDSPHYVSSFGSTPVLDVATVANDLAYATIGGDATVRVWTPGPRYRSGQKMLDKNRQHLETWRCSQSIILENVTKLATFDTKKTATVAYSEDGSVLAVCWPGYNDSRKVYLIDPQTGIIHYTRDELYTGNPRASGFLDRYLIIVADQLVVWDTVADKVVFSVAVPGNAVSETSTDSPTLLALNAKSQSFAFASRVLTKHKSSKNNSSRVVVLRPDNPRPLFQSNLKFGCRSLLPDLRTGEYVLIDSAAQIHRITSGDTVPSAPVIHESTPSLKTGLDNIFGGALGRVGGALPGTVEQTHQPDIAGPVGGISDTRALSEVFDVGPSFALPSVDVLFNDVVGHFRSKAATA